MPHSSSQSCLKDLDKKLLTVADRLRLVAMNMANRGIDFTFGKEPAKSFTSDQRPDLRADFVMGNSPLNMSEWWDAKLEGDPRWKYGTPPKRSANFAWIQHMLHHLAPA